MDSGSNGCILSLFQKISNFSGQKQTLFSFHGPPERKILLIGKKLLKFKYCLEFFVMVLLIIKNKIFYIKKK
jgi:hypothetical protein